MKKMVMQQERIKRRNGYLAAAVLLWGMLAISTQGVVLAADDGYLKALEAEAENSAHVQEKKPEAKKPKSLQEEFEEQLKAERPNTFNFYEKLTPEDKATVLATYKESHRLSPAARKVLDLYFK